MSILSNWLATWRQRRAARRRATKPTAFRPWPRPELLEDRLAPAVFTVSSLADSGAGTLRQAILDANAHVNSAADPSDTVVFTVSGTVNVLSALPALSDATGGTVID